MEWVDGAPRAKTGEAVFLSSVGCAISFPQGASASRRTEHIGDHSTRVGFQYARGRLVRKEATLLLSSARIVFFIILSLKSPFILVGAVTLMGLLHQSSELRLPTLDGPLKGDTLLVFADAMRYFTLHIVARPTAQLAG